MLELGRVRGSRILFLRSSLTSWTSYCPSPIYITQSAMSEKQVPAFKVKRKLLFFLVPDRPPTDITAFSVGTDVVGITWNPVSLEYANGKVLGYRVLYNDGNETSRANSNVTPPEVTHSEIKGLRPNTNYSFHVLAFTAKGDGPVSATFFAKTQSGIKDVLQHRWCCF